MPNDATNSQNSLWNQLDEDKAVQLQKLFNANGIHINIRTHAGFDLIMKDTADAPADYFFGQDKNMRDMSSDGTAKAEAVKNLKEALMGGPSHPTGVYVYEGGDRNRLMRLAFDETTGEFQLTQPTRDLTKKATRPSLWMRFAHAVFGAYKEEFREYNKTKNDRKMFEDIKKKHEAYAEKRNAAAVSYRKCLSQVTQKIKSLDGLEQFTDKKLDRLDYMMVNGNTLRELMTRHYVRMDDTAKEAMFKGGATYSDVAKDEQVARSISGVVLNAMVNGQAVRYASVDENSGIIGVNNMTEPDALKEMQQSAEQSELVADLSNQNTWLPYFQNDEMLRWGEVQREANQLAAEKLRANDEKIYEDSLGDIQQSLDERFKGMASYERMDHIWIENHTLHEVLNEHIRQSGKQDPEAELARMSDSERDKLMSGVVLNAMFNDHPVRSSRVTDGNVRRVMMPVYRPASLSQAYKNQDTRRIEAITQISNEKYPVDYEIATNEPQKRSAEENYEMCVNEIQDTLNGRFSGVNSVSRTRAVQIDGKRLKDILCEDVCKTHPEINGDTEATQFLDRMPQKDLDRLMSEKILNAMLNGRHVVSAMADGTGAWERSANSKIVMHYFNDSHLRTMSLRDKEMLDTITKMSNEKTSLGERNVSQSAPEQKEAEKQVKVEEQQVKAEQPAKVEEPVKKEAPQEKVGEAAPANPEASANAKELYENCLGEVQQEFDAKLAGMDTTDRMNDIWIDGDTLQEVMRTHLRDVKGESDPDTALQNMPEDERKKLMCRTVLDAMLDKKMVTASNQEVSEPGETDIEQDPRIVLASPKKSINAEKADQIKDIIQLSNREFHPERLPLDSLPFAEKCQRQMQACLDKNLAGYSPMAALRCVQINRISLLHFAQKDIAQAHPEVNGNERKIENIMKGMSSKQLGDLANGIMLNAMAKGQQVTSYVKDPATNDWMKSKENHMLIAKMEPEAFKNAKQSEDKSELEAFIKESNQRFHLDYSKKPTLVEKATEKTVEQSKIKQPSSNAPLI